MPNVEGSIILALLALGSSLSQALPGNDYRCRIERVYGTEPDESPVVASERKRTVGSEFTVERRTGVLAGALKNAFATQPVVIDAGSRDNSFKAVTTMRLDQGAGRGSSVYTLVVKEYVDSSKKPFVFLSDDIVYFGTCAHF